MNPAIDAVQAVTFWSQPRSEQHDTWPVWSPVTDLFIRAMAGDPYAIADLLDRRLIKEVPGGPFSLEWDPGDRRSYDYAKGTLDWDHAFPPDPPRSRRERKEYSPEWVQLTLMRYQDYQDRGLNRGTDAQITTIAKRIDVWLGFNALNRSERLIVLMLYMHGLTTRDVAKAIGKSHTTVQRQGARALKKMSAYINYLESVG